MQFTFKWTATISPYDKMKRENKWPPYELLIFRVIFSSTLDDVYYVY